MKAKKLISALLASLLLLSLFSSCDNNSVNDETVYFGDEDIGNGVADRENFLDIAKQVRGVWFSYLELEAAPKGSEKEFSAYLSERFQKLKEHDINTVFVHVRPFADAIYESSLFPSSFCVAKRQGEKLSFDFLSVIIEQAKRFDLSVHAWINPYRILPKGKEKEKLSANSPGKTCAYPDVVTLDEGVFFSPALLKEQRLIISGVREILENYDVSGIHIDDYFYPSESEKIDCVQFEEYKKAGGALSLSEWRRENVNALVRGIYLEVKRFSPKKVFSISPCGNLEKNYAQYYADTEKWGSEDGWCDLIIPQLYFGFENESLPFESCAKEWKSAVKSKNVRLCAGLSLYKEGKEDPNAGESGKDEWIKNNDIIVRQIKFLEENGYDGYCLYSMSFLN